MKRKQGLAKKCDAEAAKAEEEITATQDTYEQKITALKQKHDEKIVQLTRAYNQQVSKLRMQEEVQLEKLKKISASKREQAKKAASVAEHHKEKWENWGKPGRSKRKPGRSKRKPGAGKLEQIEKAIELLAEHGIYVHEASGGDDNDVDDSVDDGDSTERDPRPTKKPRGPYVIDDSSDNSSSSD